MPLPDRRAIEPFNHLVHKAPPRNCAKLVVGRVHVQAATHVPQVRARRAMMYQT